MGSIEGRTVAMLGMEGGILDTRADGNSEIEEEVDKEGTVESETKGPVEGITDGRADASRAGGTGN